MTLTASRPAQSPGAPETEIPTAAAMLPESPFTTSDHKRIGRYYIGAGVLFVLVGTVIAVIMELQLGSKSINLSSADYDRLFNLHTTVSSLLFLPLLFVGLGDLPGPAPDRGPPAGVPPGAGHGLLGHRLRRDPAARQLHLRPAQRMGAGLPDRPAHREAGGLPGHRPVDGAPCCSSPWPR